MADFSALKTSIQNYIKQNGNEEITGNLLQQILLSMVSTLGDSAINNLVAALNAEIVNRGNADTELGGSITTLQGVVNGIKSNVENGYVYAGIATPSTTPVSGKVFYLALNAGTYTNFGATVVPQGINILKYNGSAWSLDSFLGLDDAPTQGSNNLVKSGGVYTTLYGNINEFTHTYEQQEDWGDHAFFDSPLPIGTKIFSIENSINNSVLWLSNSDGRSIKNLTEETLPFITDTIYYGVNCSTNGNTTKITFSLSSTPSKGISGRLDDVEDLTDELSAEYESLSLLTKGNSSYFKHTYSQSEPYGDHALFPEPLPAGTYINSLKNSINNATIWLSGELGTSIKELTGQELPFITDQAYYGINCDINENTAEINYSPAPKVNGLKDDVLELHEIVLPLENARKVIRVLSTDTQFQLFQKMRTAFLEGNCDVYFEKATYTLDEVYHDIVAAQGTWAVGLPIGNDCRYYMNGSTIISNEPATPTGSDTRNILDCQVSGQNFELYDAILINNGGVYCVHDEGNASEIPYIHKYQNVQMFYNETEDTPGPGAKPFGCGLGYNSTLVFDSCYFAHSNSIRSAFAIHGINTQNPGPCIFKLSMRSSCIKNQTMDMNLLDATRDTIEYYLCNNKWGVDFDDSNSTLSVKYNNVIG